MLAGDFWKYFSLYFQVHQKTNAHKLAEYHSRMLKEIDYKNDADAKPPYSYAALICLAMKDTKKKMTLSQIYKWIRDSFAYYRKADKSWQVRWWQIRKLIFTYRLHTTRYYTLGKNCFESHIQIFIVLWSHDFFSRKIFQILLPISKLKKSWNPFP